MYALSVRGRSYSPQMEAILVNCAAEKQTAEQTTDGNVSNLQTMHEKIELLTFGGLLRDYVIWKRRWTTTVNYPETPGCIMGQECIQKEMVTNVTHLSGIKEIWEVMDTEYLNKKKFMVLLLDSLWN